MIFSRARGGRHSRADEAAGGRGRHAVDEPAAADDHVERPEFGPYDVTQAGRDGVERLDLGSLRIPAVSGVEVRVQANPDGAVQAIQLVHGTSVLQLGAFAAPRSEGIWEEVRAEIRKSLFADGIAAEEVPDGDYGIELRARVRNPEGLLDIRFVGVDGPRWFVRAVYQGPAAVDPAGAGPLREVLRGLIVDRGNQAMPVKEALPLRLPAGVAEQAAAVQAAEAGPGAGAAPAPSVPLLNLHGGDPAAGAPIDDGDRPRRRPSPRPRKREA